MAISRSALTNGTDIAGGATSTTASVSVTAGACLVVGFHHRDADGPAASVSWNGNALTRRALRDNLADTRCEIWLLENAPAGSGTVVITHSSTPPACIAYFATEYGNVMAAAFDVSKVNSGSSTSPSTGASATLAQAAEEAVAAIGTNGPQGDSAGSWSNSFTAGARVGTTGASADVTVSEGYKQLAATTAVTAAKASITNRAWMAAVITLMEQTTQTSSPTVLDVPVDANDATWTNPITTEPAVLDVPVDANDATWSNPITSAPAVLDVPVDANGATGVPGAMTSTVPAEIDVPVTANDAALVAGLIVLSPDSVDVPVEVDVTEAAGGGITIETAPRDPEAITSLNPIVVRPSTPAFLGDADFSTTGDGGQTPQNPAGGTQQCGADALVPLVPTPPGGIAYIRIRAIAWVSELHELSTGHYSNRRFEYTFDGDTSSAAATIDDPGVDAVSMLRRDVDGIDPGENDQATPDYFVSSGDITTKPGGGAWTWDALAALEDIALKYDYTAAAFFAEMIVSELWIEVYGAIGSVPAVLSLEQSMGSIRRRQQIRQTLGG